MRITLYFLVFCTFFGAPYSFAQDSSISKDSINTLLEKAYDAYYDYDYKGTLEITSKLLDEGRKSENDYLTFRAYIFLGQIHSDVKDTIRSRNYYEKALETALHSKQDSLLAWAYNDLANSYDSDIPNYPKAIRYYKKAIEINNKAGLPDYDNLAQYMNIAWTHLDLEEPEKAKPYLDKSRILVEQKEQHPLRTLNLDILFGRYLFYSEREPDQMIAIFQEAAQKAKDLNFLEQGSEANHFLALAAERTGDMAGVVTYLREQKEIDEKIRDIEKEFIVAETSAKFDLQQYERNLETAKIEKEYSDKLVAKSNIISTIFIIASSVSFVAFIAFFLLFKARKKYIRKLRSTNEELRVAKNEAERLSQLKTQFFSTVSHELRTPLYGVIGISSILLDDPRLKKHKDDLKSLKFSADYLLALINDVLILNKMDANSLRLEKTPFSLSKLLNNIKRSFAFSSEQNKNTIHLELDESIPDQLKGDSVRLSQVLMNLVGNAVKFNENGNIWISTKLIENPKTGVIRTQFTIKDDGIGIPEEKQNSIFEEFSQIENNNYNYQGTGLGLPIVKKLLTLFGSEVSLESSLGKGATFTFHIDFESYQVPAEAMEISDTTDAFITEKHVFKNVHILVVDDNRINQKITQKILETRHFLCSIADNGEEAINMTQKNEYDLILMDIHMPGMGGLKATEAIREFNAQIPIVALTAVEIDEIRKNIIDSGMNDIILKPYDVSEFLNTILRNLITVPMEREQKML